MATGRMAMKAMDVVAALARRTPSYGYPWPSQMEQEKCSDCDCQRTHWEKGQGVCAREMPVRIARNDDGTFTTWEELKLFD
jgi:hypothetical protein